MAIHPSANEAQIRCKEFYLYHTLVFNFTLEDLGLYLQNMETNSQKLIIISVKKELEVLPMQIPFRFLTSARQEMYIVLYALGL